jgi:hypothetical protein
MTRAQRILRQLRKGRTPAVSGQTLARVDKIATDRKKAVTFLKRGGFLDKDGKLAAKYRLQAE